jgi:hypothetical protein
VRLLLTGGLVAALCATEAPAGDQKTADCDGMVGVWEYVKPSAPGYAIIAKHEARYLGTFVNTLAEPDPRQPIPAAGQEGAMVHPQSFVGTWEYTCEGKAGNLRIRLRWLYSSYRPQDVGSEANLEVEMEGRQAQWWFIGADGKRGTMGAGRLIR